MPAFRDGFCGLIQIIRQEGWPLTPHQEARLNRVPLVVRAGQLALPLGRYPVPLRWSVSMM